MYVMLKLNGGSMEFSILQYEVDLKNFIVELTKETEELATVQKKAAIERRNLSLLIDGLVTHDEYRGYMEKKDFSKYNSMKKFLSENAFYEFPMLHMFHRAGLSFNQILKCLDKTRADILDEMKLNGLVVEGLVDMEIVLTTLVYHRYNNSEFYLKNRPVAEKFAVELSKKKVFRSKISTLTGLTYAEIDVLSSLKE